MDEKSYQSGNWCYNKKGQLESLQQFSFNHNTKKRKKTNQIFKLKNLKLFTCCVKPIQYTRHKLTRVSFCRVNTANPVQPGLNLSSPSLELGLTRVEPRLV